MRAADAVEIRPRSRVGESPKSRRVIVRHTELKAKEAGRSLGGLDRFDGAGASIRTVLARAGIDCMADLWSRWVTTEEFTMTGFEAVARVEVSAPPGRVWIAMTDPDQVAQYMMGSRVDTDWKPGSPITWSGEWEGKPYQDKGKILVAEPGRVLEVTHYSPLAGDEDVPGNYHTVRYELSPAEDGTAVSLTQGGCESEKQAEQFAQNWSGILDGLKKVAEAG